MRRMSNFKRIRASLGLSQDALAKLLGMTQGNVSFYELGRQAVPPDVAGRLIDIAKKRGHTVTFDDIYRQPRTKPARVAA